MHEQGGSRVSVSVHDVVESLGFGKFQWAALVLGGGVWLADGSELLLIGSVTRSLSKDWGLTGGERGTIVSVLFAGVLLGNALSGTIGDRYGRRLPILISYLLIVFFSACSAATSGVWSMTSARVLVGVSFGIGQPSWLALSTEIVPTKSRVLMNGMGMILFVLGELYAALLVYEEDPRMKELRWRWLLLVGAVPSAILGCCASLGLYESPSFLASQGRVGEARKVLDAMRQANGADVPIDFSAQPRPSDEESRWSQLSVVFGRHLRFTTLVTCFSTFTMNFIFYGGLYAFPQVLPKLNLHLSPAASLALGAFMEIPGFFMGMAVCIYMTRKGATLLYLACSVGAITCFLLGTGDYGVERAESLLLIGYMGLKMFVNLGFLVVYLYASEIYPTRVRNTGSAVCLAAGRIGSMICPLVYELYEHAGGSYQGFFVFTAALCLVNAGLTSMLAIETANTQLDHAEMEKLAKLEHA